MTGRREPPRGPEGPGEAAASYASNADRARRAFIAGHDELAREVLWFFYELDRRTNPNLFHAGREDGLYSPLENRLLDAIGAVQRFLLRRVEARCSGTSLPTTRSELIPDVRWLSRLQRPIYEACFGGVAHLTAKRAFARFASGEFFRGAVHRWNAAPDSPQYVQFAEFSLLCLELDIDAGLWSRTLEAHVLSQPVYDQAFRDASGRRSGEPLRRDTAQVAALVEAATRYDGSVLAPERLSSLHDVHVKAVMSP